MLGRRLTPIPLIVCALHAVSFAAPPTVVVRSACDEAVGNPPYVPGQLIVKYRSGVSSAHRGALRDSLQARTVHGFRNQELELIALPDRPVEAARKRLEADPDVEYAEPNYVVRLASHCPSLEDPRFNEQWNLTSPGSSTGGINATDAWETYTQAGIVIGVFDSGTDLLHPDLPKWKNPGEQLTANGVDDDVNGYVDDIWGYDFVNGDGDPTDDDGHGTAVAGIAAAKMCNALGIAGVSRGAPVATLKVLDSLGCGTVANVIRALEYCTAQGIKVTNHSYGRECPDYLPFSQAWLDAINAFGAAGGLFIAAAGNSAANNDVSPYYYPSSYSSPYIIAVAASTSANTLTSLSCWGAKSVDLAAPGESILSTQSCAFSESGCDPRTPGGDYWPYYSGTSFAAPHVAGVASLVWGAYPAISNLQVKHLILDNVAPVSAWSTLLKTGGRLNADLPTPTTDTTPPSDITDLAQAATGTSSIQLRWTAKGDDGTSGYAARYDIRYFTDPITPSNFGSATQLPSPDPMENGLQETLVVTGLEACTYYWFAVKVVDDAGNFSGISNIVSGRTRCVDGGSSEEARGTDGGLVAELRFPTVRPNPLSAATQIEFSIPRPARVRVQVFDLLGRAVRTIEDAPLEAGTFSRGWDATDDHGQRVQPGLYLIRVRAGADAATRRVLVVQ